MLIGGEKYACETCVRGHRVSSCQHADRPLIHINKKGRPITQCRHCRGLRKTRASHVACECGAKPHSKEECLEEKSSDDSTSDPGSEHTCCCSHGLRCTCALKKEHPLDPVPEVDLPVKPPRRRTSSKKPGLAKAGSDTSLTVFANGHHKPIHKHNASAHQCGMPYKIPIPHSVHGNADVARRSVDSLPLMKRNDEPRTESVSQSDVDLSNIEAEPVAETVSQPQQRLSTSEHGSPLPRRLKDELPPLDFTYQQIKKSSMDDCIQSPFYPPPDDKPVLSAGLSMTPSFDWSAFDLPTEIFSTAYSQPASFTSYSPDDLRISSGELLEQLEEDGYTSCGQDERFRPGLVRATPEERSLNRLSSSSYTSIPPPSLPALDFDSYLHRSTSSSSTVEESSPGIQLGSDAFSKHGFTVHDAQKMAHPESGTDPADELELPNPGDENVAIWSGTCSPSETSFVSQNRAQPPSWER
ncbi:MAG: hypothetical protein Q9163_003231 [Psora crenata]